ncbi:Activating transcription factor 7-interacting protein 1 [Frankliniella fusca]|uniref:Activating transcription factor 7-interacting protein 1 n=1 Tax=Frankliniella fusca TaxID=407009 RepID=A0AAE1GW66_9NEOP|nr:Activating transcription factor 7-interacting protein 1 [Frankliniella fusca]
MKLAEDIREELMSTSMTSCENPSEESPLKSGKTLIDNSQEKNSNPHLSNGQNGIDNSLVNPSKCDGSPDHPTNHDLNEDSIGFEVESYSEIDSPFPPEKHSEIDLDKEESQTALVISKCVSEEHDSSHLSDEFNLRLSDEEELNEASTPSARHASENETAISTTEDSCDLVSHEDNSKSSSGPERNGLPSDTSPNPKPVIEGDTNLLKSTSDEESVVTLKEMSSEASMKDSQTLEDGRISPEKVNEEIPPEKSIKLTASEQNKPKDDEQTHSTEETLNGTNITCLNPEQDNLAVSTDIALTNDRQENLEVDSDVAVTNLPELSLEDKIEAELEAELQAEIAAQKETVQSAPFKPTSSKDDEVVDPPIDSSVKQSICKVDPVSEAGLAGSSKAGSNHLDSAGCTKEEQNVYNITQEKPGNILLKVKAETKCDYSEDKVCKETPEIKSESDSVVNVKIESELKSEIKIKVKVEPGLEEENFLKQELELKSEVDIESLVKSEPNIKIEPEPDCSIDSSNMKISSEVQDIPNEEYVQDGQSRSESNSISDSLQTPDDEHSKTAETIDSTTSSKTATSEDTLIVPDINDTLCSGSSSTAAETVDSTSNSKTATSEDTLIVPDTNDTICSGNSTTTAETIDSPNNSKTATSEDTHIVSDNNDTMSSSNSTATAETIEGTSTLAITPDTPLDPDKNDTICNDNTEALMTEKSPSSHSDVNTGPETQRDSELDEFTSSSKDQSETADSEDSESRLLSPLQENANSEEADDTEDMILRAGSNDRNTNLDDEDNEDMGLTPHERSDTNSLISDNDFECQDTELPGESDNSSSGDNSDNCETNENDDFDAICENETNNTFKDVANQGVEAVSTEFDSNSTKALGYRDSTGFETSPTDNMDNRDFSNIVSERNDSGGYNTDLSSRTRKRTLSRSEDDSCDSFRSKKPNGFPEIREANDTSDAGMQTQTDSGHKRPAERIEDFERKKFRASEESVSEEASEVDQDENEKQRMDEERLLNSPNAGSLQEASLPELSKTPDSFSDHSTEAVKAPSVSTDLPFLRKLYKKELSKMTRSDLEELVVQKICEAITERSVVGDLRLRCQELEKRQEKENERFNKLRKQMTELGLVVKKYMEQQSKNPAAKIIKITRSVGLQVSQSVKHLPTCAHVRTRLPQTPIAKQPLPASKPAPVTPFRPDMSYSEISCQTRTPVKSYRNSSSSPRSSVISSTEPPSLAPTQRVEKVVANKQPSTPSPRLQVPPLQQITGTRPRSTIPVSASPTSTASPPTSAHKIVSSTSVPAQPKQQPSPIRQSLPQNTNRPSVATNNSDVEVIDIIDKVDKNTKKTAGAQISIQQQSQQAKQAANAAAQNLATNSGMTVRLISPTQVSQAGVLSTGFPQLIMSNSAPGMPQKMILASSQGSPIRGNLKLVVQGKPGNVLIPFSSSSGSTPSSAVVQQVQQIFSSASMSNKTNTVATAQQQPRQLQPTHPAPLPTGPPIQASNPLWRQIPPRPNLKIQHQNNGIVLSWNMALGPTYADIDSYQLYAYQEGSAPPSAGLWKKVGDVKALPLPMACTLTQFVEGHRYHFTVRAVDKHGRVGPFSQQGSIRLGN